MCATPPDCTAGPSFCRSAAPSMNGAPFSFPKLSAPIPSGKEWQKITSQYTRASRPPEQQTGVLIVAAPARCPSRDGDAKPLDEEALVWKTGAVSASHQRFSNGYPDKFVGHSENSYAKSVPSHSVSTTGMKTHHDSDMTVGNITDSQSCNETKWVTNVAKCSKTPLLDALGRDLTHIAAKGELDVLIGQEREIEQMIQTLARRGKNNPLLIGDPGVGRTATAEGLAQKIANGEVPDFVREKRIVQIDVATLLAGAQNRSALVARMKSVVDEVAASGNNVVLFIDDIHTIVDAGRSGNGDSVVDAATILEPVIGRVDLQCIGATTPEHYRVHFEKEASLECRFQPISVCQALINEDESMRTLHLEAELGHRIVGQGPAIATVSKTLRLAHLGLKRPNRPIASVLFCGPTGVGKTELCKAVSDVYFGHENAMIRLDMSEFTEMHSVSKLIESLAADIGYGDGHQQTDRICRKAQTLILFDEIEKAHSAVCNVVMQIMEDGCLTDAIGRKVSFINAFIFMTSKSAPVSSEVGTVLSPEFLSRLDSIISFSPLGRKEIEDIAELEFAKTIEVVKQKGASLTLSKAFKETVIDRGFDVAYGARPLRRSVATLLVDELANSVLAKSLAEGEQVHVDVGVDQEVVVLRRPTKERVDREQMSRNHLTRTPAKTKKVVKQRGASLTLSKAVKDKMIDQSFDVAYGARPVRRSVATVPVDELPNSALADALIEGEQVHVNVGRDQEIVVSRRPTKERIDREQTSRTGVPCAPTKTSRAVKQKGGSWTLSKAVNDEATDQKNVVGYPRAPTKTIKAVKQKGSPWTLSKAYKDRIIHQNVDVAYGTRPPHRSVATLLDKLKASWRDEGKLRRGPKTNLRVEGEQVRVDVSCDEEAVMRRPTKERAIQKETSRYGVPCAPTKENVAAGFAHIPRSLDTIDEAHETDSTRDSESSDIMLCESKREY